MASTWSNLGLRLMATGENDNTWGAQTNDNWNRMEDSTDGYISVALSSTTHTATFTTQPTSYASEEGRKRVINYTGSPGGTCTVTLPNIEKVFVVRNNTDQSLIFTAGTGAQTVTLASGFDAQIYVDGSDEVHNCFDALSNAVPTTSQVVTALSGATLTGALTIDNDLTLQGAAANIVFDESDNALEFADNAKARFGTGNDLEIYHDGSNSFISDEGTGVLAVTTNGTAIQLNAAGEQMAAFNKDDAVELYYDNAKKLETYASGVQVTGNCWLNQDNGILAVGAGTDLQIKHDGTDNIIDNHAADLHIKHGSEFQAKFINDGAVELFHNNVHMFSTTSQGVQVEADRRIEIVNGTNWSGEQVGKIEQHSDSMYHQYNTSWIARNSSGNNMFVLDSSGNGTFNANVTAFSDYRIKEDIKTIDNALDKVSKLRGVEYTRKETKAREIGVIAQEVKEIVPELVNIENTKSDINPEGLEDLHTMKYQNTVGLLIEAIKDLKEDLDNHKKHCTCGDK